MIEKILVTGGCKGIGLAVTEKFLRAGHYVTATYNSSDKAARKLAEKYPRFMGVNLDLSGDFSIREIENSEFDILINNAGIAEQKLFTDITDSDFDRMFDINIKSVFRITKSVVPSMIRKKRGCIINISSVWGITGASCEVHYSASKAAVIGFTKALAKELAPSGIRVNCIAPGVIDTEMNAHLSPETLKELIDETPLGRIGTPADIAGAAYFLSSDDAAFITGQVLTVDGGFSGV
jgi:3-oxoacyl-[acyl-carrier protein] reductase